MRDPRELNEPGKGLGRDPVRTPMPWDGSANAGFTSGEPWLPLNADWPARNVAAQQADPESMLTLHHDLLALRRAHTPLRSGDLRLLDSDRDVLAYERVLGDARVVIGLNLGASEASFATDLKPLLSTLADAPPPGVLRPNEGVLFA